MTTNNTNTNIANVESTEVLKELEAMVGPELAKAIEAKMTSMAEELEGLSSGEKLLLIMKLSKEIVSDSVEPVRRVSKKAVGKTAVVGGKTMEKAGNAIIKVGEVVRDAGKRTQKWGITLDQVSPENREIVEQVLRESGLTPKQA
jgi:hypothetical protein